MRDENEKLESKARSITMSTDWRHACDQELTFCLLGLDQRRSATTRMTAMYKSVEGIVARVFGILRVITTPRVWAKEVAMARVIEFYIPKNFRKSFKRVPELQRGKILEFYPQTKKSA